jgi:DNA-binding MarR family transcriptional regulator
VTKIIQAPKSRKAVFRSELLGALEKGFREVSATGIVLHQAVADSLGLYLTDHKCMGMLCEMGPLSAGKLAELTGLTTGAITGVLNRLERAGYARRVRNPEDRRNVRVEPQNVAKFNQRMEELLGPLRSEMQGLSSKYSAPQLALILEFMKASVAISREEVQRIRFRNSGKKYLRKRVRESASSGALKTVRATKEVIAG